MRILLLLGALVAFAVPASAQTLEELMARLPEGNFDAREAVVAEIARLGDERAVPLLQALAEGELHRRESDGAILRVEIGEVAPRSTQQIRVNNSLRRAVRSALRTMTLMAENPRRRMAAAEELLRRPDPDQIDGAGVLRAEQCMEGIPEMIEAVQVEATFPDGTKLVTVHHPIR